MNRIKEVLHDQERTQKWLAEQVGKSYIVLTNYCNNKNQPSIETLYKIAAILKVDVRELMISSSEFEHRLNINNQ